MSTAARNFAPILLRFAMAFVFLWFGTQQIIDPASWFGFLPDWTLSLPLSQTMFVSLNGWLEVLLGLFLFAGYHLRAAALILALHLFGIAYTVGYGAIGIRDIGLAFATLSVCLHGPDRWSFDDIAL